VAFGAIERLMLRVREDREREPALGNVYRGNSQQVATILGGLNDMTVVAAITLAHRLYGLVQLFIYPCNRFPVFEGKSCVVIMQGV